MSFTRQDFAVAFLGALGNTHPSQNVVDWVIGWTVHETCTNCEAACSYNLLNTHQGGWPKCGGDNGAVSAFPNLTTGAAVNAAVLSQGHAGYASLRQALASNDLTALTNGSVSPGLATWGTGSAAQNPAALVALGAAHRADSFGYGSASGINLSGITPAGATPTASAGGCPDAGVSADCCKNCQQFNPFDPRRYSCFVQETVCMGQGAANNIGGVFSTIWGQIGPWVGNPIRMLKLVGGVIGMAIAVLVIFWPQAEQTVVEAGKVAAMAA